jgi:poly-gamma-glutamate synthesis protein (capsule biosynthesis protein)
MKIGFLGFSDVGPIWMKATETQAGLLLASNPRFDEIVKNASEKVDYLIVSFHWGDEYKTVHNARQEYLAHKAVDAGAKIVIGHHPHVAQDVEVYKDGYIAYSLGNFVFDQAFSAETMQGLMLQIKLGRDGTMTAQKNIVKLNSVFQPEKVIEGKEEEIIFLTN